MTILAWILGSLGGVCTVMGILTALEILPTFISGAQLVGALGITTAFWWGLAAILLLGSIAAAIGARPRYE